MLCFVVAVVAFQFGEGFALGKDSPPRHVDDFMHRICQRFGTERKRQGCIECDAHTSDDGHAVHGQRNGDDQRNGQRFSNTCNAHDSRNFASDDVWNATGVWKFYDATASHGLHSTAAATAEEGADSKHISQ